MTHIREPSTDKFPLMPKITTMWKVFRDYLGAQQDKTAILGEISPIFHSFSTNFPSMVPHPCYKLKHGTHLSFFHPHVCRLSYFLPMFAHFPPIFCLTFRPFSLVLSCQEVYRHIRTVVLVCTELNSIEIICKEINLSLPLL